MNASPLCRRLTAWTAAATLAVLSCLASAGNPNFDRVVAFGASLTDSGNAFAWLSDHPECGVRLTLPPYDTLDDLLVPDGPYAKGGHHFSNGATWVEGMARGLALAGNARAAFATDGLEASNYAVGGARAVPGYPCRVNLPDQVGAYLAEFGATSPRTLVATEIGGNDVRDAFVAVLLTSNPDAAAPFIAAALQSLGASIQQLYAGGARRFLVVNVGDIGRSPAVRSLGPIAQFVGNLVAMGYNQALAGLIGSLNLALPGIEIRVLDAYAVLNEVLDDPAAFGFANTTDACVTPDVPPYVCKKPDTYVFWDGTHPTKAMHAILAHKALSVVATPWAP
jgi:phospholipase/lecithinase/hemolysin